MSFTRFFPAASRSRRKTALSLASGLCLGHGLLYAQKSAVPVVWVLPDSPGLAVASGPETFAVPAPQLGTEIRPSATVAGTVMDLNGNPVAGAKVELLSQNRFSGALDARADQDGSFKMVVPAGTYRMIITSQGLEPLIIPDFVVAQGTTYTVPKIAMKITATSADVTVRVTQEEIAQEQIHAAEKQRVFGILPNFYSSYIWDAAPLTSKQKFDLAGHSMLDPVSFGTRLIGAAVAQKLNTYPGYGQGVDGFGQRYGAIYGASGFARIIGSAILPSITRQDPRYFYKGTGSLQSRAVYAVTRAVITRGNNGKSQLNISKIGGAFAAGAISTLYLPDGSNGPSSIFKTGLLETAGSAFDNLFREFLLRRVTPSVPEFEQGQPEGEASHSQPTKRPLPVADGAQPDAAQGAAGPGSAKL